MKPHRIVSKENRRASAAFVGMLSALDDSVRALGSSHTAGRAWEANWFAVENYVGGLERQVNTLVQSNLDRVSPSNREEGGRDE